MIKTILRIFILFLTLPLYSIGFNDFDDLVYGAIETRCVGFAEDFRFYKRVYERNISALFQNSEMNRIPKVMHFIWFGPKPYPESSKRNVESWMAHHPTWTIKFWTDSHMKTPPVSGVEHHHFSEIKMHNQDLFKRSQNWGEKADIFRYEILYQEGGVYIDHDIECMRSFDALNSGYDLYAFLEMPHPNPVARVFFFPSNGLIGAIPNHPILDKTIKLVRTRWAKAREEFVGNIPQNGYYMVMYRTFLSFVYAVRSELDDPSYQNICFPIACWSKHALGPNVDPEVLLCHHAFVGSWIPENPPSPKKKKKK